MFRPNLTREQHISLLKDMSDEEFAQFRYCQEMAGTYVAVGKFETMLISAMQMCDGIKLKTTLGHDAERWQQFLAKREVLHGSTLGSMIKILKRHPVAEGDIAYLNWIKEKRDYFVHRLFHEGAFPGDLSESDCQFMTRRLLAIQLWLGRAERNIWSIFKRAGFVELTHVAGGMLVMNKGVYDFLQKPAASES
ncbi:hypothetical protein [Rhizobium leguminosarum]|uniref:hypothetical protein n=1 Tax=Rhizobium leguminosarum TaxID=384 RepID=UPI0010309FF0|nr:hypothetical protein [Rhizobium leguminosarum]TAV81567.1 hypothetical protein ELI22_33985 [Rhizobium leguminosarum]TAV94173.1 hypothetical protein ELI21_10380 [Rhizobium leguminosarum]TAW35248.1 hypothetical protein ELI23_10420 [Rhizobium leguminosarum]